MKGKPVVFFIFIHQLQSTVSVTCLPLRLTAATKMHTKSDSEVTSVDQLSLPRSPRRPLYYVQSPSNHDVEKMSYGSSPMGSPHHYSYHQYHASPIHHSRESSTSRFSASLKNPRQLSTWRKLHEHHESEDDEEDEDAVQDSGRNLRLYFCLFLAFVLLFTTFSLILWGASKSYDPKVLVKNIVFEKLNVQAGNDGSGVATDMLSLNSTVKMLYRNPATFFGVHVTSTPFEFYYYQIRIASGQMEEFYQSRKSQRNVVVVVKSYQVPLYGGVPVLAGANEHMDTVALPLNLTLMLRSRAYILGRLVKSKFYRRIRCSVTLHGNKLGKPVNVRNSCVYHD